MNARNERFPLFSCSDPVSTWGSFCLGWGFYASHADQKLEGYDRCSIFSCLLGCLLPCASAWSLRRKTADRYGFDENTAEDCASAILCPCATIDESNREIDFYENRAEVRRARQAVHGTMTAPGGYRGFRAR